MYVCMYVCRKSYSVHEGRYRGCGMQFVGTVAMRSEKIDGKIGLLRMSGRH